jgi:hypothetical protein
MSRQPSTSAPSTGTASTTVHLRTITAFPSVTPGTWPDASPGYVPGPLP